MNSYKADITLNEKDSLQDMLNLEKSLVKIYSTAITEGCSKGFRTLVKAHWGEATEDQMKVFLQMTEHGDYEVQSAEQTILSENKNKFMQVKGQLSWRKNSAEFNVFCSVAYVFVCTITRKVFFLVFFSSMEVDFFHFHLLDF